MVVWFGAGGAVAARLRVDTHGIEVVNTVYRAWIPWAELTDAHTSFFGLRLQTERFRMPVLVCQSTNGSELSTDPPMAQLGRQLMEIRSEASIGPTRSAEAGDAAASKGMRTAFVIWVAAVVPTYSLATFLWVLSRSTS